MPPALPKPRGPLSGAVLALLTDGRPISPTFPVGGGDVLGDADLQLALYCCYEMSYRGFAGVDDAREWDPDLLALRSELEGAFAAGLDDIVPLVPVDGDPAAAIAHRLRDFSGPSLSTYVAERASRAQIREMCIHRSAYQLKEADPHTWAIPRLGGRAKAAMVEIQADEYGGGVEAEMHSTLFADTMRALGLDATYGAYLDLLPAPTLATVNLVSMFGLHRRLRGHLVGHLAVFEMTSVVPMGRYSKALARIGLGASARRFFDVHVEADAHHQVIAADDLVGGLAQSEPALIPDIVRGAELLLAVEDRFARHLLDSWQRGRSSLLSQPGVAAIAG